MYRSFIMVENIILLDFVVHFGCELNPPLFCWDSTICSLASAAGKHINASYLTPEQNLQTQKAKYMK